jgi:hypothetical protein
MLLDVCPQTPGARIRALGFAQAAVALIALMACARRPFGRAAPLAGRNHKVSS